MATYNVHADEKHVRPLGRTLYENDVLWCGLSASGAEFEFEGTSLSFKLKGDDKTFDGSRKYSLFGDEPALLKDPCRESTRISVIINEEIVFKGYVDYKDFEIEVMKSAKTRKVTVQIIKISDAVR